MGRVGIVPENSELQMLPFNGRLLSRGVPGEDGIEYKIVIFHFDRLPQLQPGLMIHSAQRRDSAGTPRIVLHDSVKCRVDMGRVIIRGVSTSHVGSRNALLGRLRLFPGLVLRRCKPL